MAHDTHNRGLIKRTARDSIIYLPAMIVPAIIGIIMLRVFTAIFSPEQFGYYNNALSTTGLIKTFSVVWLTSAAIRFFQVYKNENKQKEFFSSLFVATTTSALFFTIIALMVLYVIRPEMENGLFVTLQAAVLSTLFVAFFEIFVVIFRASLQPSKYTLYWSLYVVGKPVLGLVLIKSFSLGVEGLFYSWCLTPFFLIFLIFKNLDIRHNFDLLSSSWQIIRRMASYGFPLAISSLAIWILSLSDRYLIAFFTNNEQVGIYGVGFAVPEKLLNFTYMTLMLAAYPIIIENYESKNRESSQNLITELSRIYILIITPLLLIFLAMPSQILAIFADKQFAESARVTPLIAIGFYLYGLSMYVQKGLELKKKSKRIAVVSFISGAVAITSNIILIPRLGYMGAGISFIIAYSTYFIMASTMVKKVMAWHPPVRTIFNTAIASISAVAATRMVLLLTSSFLAQLFLGLLAGAFVYILFLFALKEINKDQVYRLYDFVKQLIKR